MKRGKCAFSKPTGQGRAGVLGVHYRKVHSGSIKENRSLRKLQEAPFTGHRQRGTASVKNNLKEILILGKMDLDQTS